jgi:hypothetical protein
MKLYNYNNYMNDFCYNKIILNTNLNYKLKVMNIKLNQNEIIRVINV